MTANKRQKNQVRAQMEASGTKYTEALRNLPAKHNIQDPADHLVWTPNGPEGVNHDFRQTDNPPGLILAGNEWPAIGNLDEMRFLLKVKPKEAVFYVLDELGELRGWRNDDHDLNGTTKAYITAKDRDGYDPERFVERSIKTLSRLHDELNHRYQLLKDHGFSSVGQARQKALDEYALQGIPFYENPLAMPYVFIVMSDLFAPGRIFSSLSIQEKQEFLAPISTFARTGRAAGVRILTISSNTDNVPDEIMGASTVYRQDGGLYVE